MSEQNLQQRNQRTLRKLLIWAVAMFGFAFAMVPFYDVICDITGLNGKTSTTASTEGPSQVVEDRTVTVEFITQRGEGVNGDFTSAVSGFTPPVTIAIALVYLAAASANMLSL